MISHKFVQGLISKSEIVTIIVNKKYSFLNKHISILLQEDLNP